MNWFCNLRRWIRVYVCFLLPLLAIGIALYFREYITVIVFTCLTAFITLPIFIYSEEIQKESRDDELKDFCKKTIINNQKTEIGILRSLLPAETSNQNKTKINSPSPVPQTPVSEIDINVFPIQAVLMGIQFEDRKEHIQNSNVGDILTITHSEKADHPNIYYVSNDRTGEILGLLSLELGMRLTNLYGKATSFDGELIRLQKENPISCEIKINKVKD